VPFPSPDSPPSPIATALPRRGGPVGRWIGRTALALIGWRIEGELPNRSKLVVIAAPHTSNWDFVVGIAAKFALGVDVSWLGKHTLFRWPWSVLFRWWGGIPVDRSVSQRVVPQIVDLFRARPAFVLAIAPEGTRKQVAEWRTGFWYIAHGAGVPVVPVAFDWAERAVRIGAPMETTGDLDADLRAMHGVYSGYAGKI
jgi:1-acyl-sn-glycerol-3-phosphate acyltransferase